jgi:hypothetical protein
MTEPVERGLDAARGIVTALLVVLPFWLVLCGGIAWIITKGIK